MYMYVRFIGLCLQVVVVVMVVRNLFSGVGIILSCRIDIAASMLMLTGCWFPTYVVHVCVTASSLNVTTCTCICMTTQHIAHHKMYMAYWWRYVQIEKVVYMYLHSTKAEETFAHIKLNFNQLCPGTMKILLPPFPSPSLPSGSWRNAVTSSTGLCPPT